MNALEEKGFTKSEARARTLMPTPGGRDRPSAVKGKVRIVALAGVPSGALPLRRY